MTLVTQDGRPRLIQEGASFIELGPSGDREVYVEGADLDPFEVASAWADDRTTTGQEGFVFMVGPQ